MSIVVIPTRAHLVLPILVCSLYLFSVAHFIFEGVLSTLFGLECYVCTPKMVCIFLPH